MKQHLKNDLNITFLSLFSCIYFQSMVCAPTLNFSPLSDFLFVFMKGTGIKEEQSFFL